VDASMAAGLHACTQAASTAPFCRLFMVRCARRFVLIWQCKGCCDTLLTHRGGKYKPGREQGERNVGHEREC
jgi:hypothetical protein